MKLLKLFLVLLRISPLGFFRLPAAIFKNGMNAMALLDFAARTYKEKPAIADDSETISYRQLWLESENLARLLFKKYQPRKVGFLCKNHASLIRSIFAVSRLGADIYLLNTEMSQGQLMEQFEHQQFDLLIYDLELSMKLADYQKEKISSDITHTESFQKPPRTSMGKIILLTGGTTGKPKEAAHKPSLFTYLNPFFSLFTRLKLAEYQTAYIATPIYHGYGVAVLFLFMALGKKIVISKGFEAEKACHLIREHKVEVVTVVPLMIHRMLKSNPEDLRSLSVVASGSAPLNPKLTDEVFSKLGSVLFNLYGTSETGLNIIATPEDLRYSPTTLGRKINGVPLKVLDENKREAPAGSAGQFWVSGIETGDLGYRDRHGYYFLYGRKDEMIISGGVNVFPADLEHILIQHPLVKEAAVIGVEDEKFGQRLMAFVLPVHGAALSEKELMEWLRSRTARYQMPREIVFIEKMPYTHLGKIDKKQLHI